MKWILPKKMTYEEFKKDYMDSIGGTIWYVRLCDNGYTQDQRYSFRWETFNAGDCPEWDDEEFCEKYIDDEGLMDETVVDMLIEAYSDAIECDIREAYDAYLEWYEDYENDVLGKED